MCIPFIHVTPRLTPEEISEAFATLDPNSWECSCKCCGTYYTGTFDSEYKHSNLPPDDIDFACPKCGYDKNSMGSPAGGMNLIYMVID